MLKTYILGYFGQYFNKVVEIMHFLKHKFLKLPV